MRVSQAKSRYCALSAALAALTIGCSTSGREQPDQKQGALLQPIVVSAELEGDSLVVERRILNDDGLSAVQDQMSLPAYSGSYVGLLQIAPIGKYAFITARSLSIMSFPQPQAGVHSVWILQTEPLALLRELALPEDTPAPYWVDERTLRFPVGDHEKNCVDYVLGADGEVSSKIIAVEPVRPTTTHGRAASDELNKRGFEWVAAPGGPQPFSPDRFDEDFGNPIVSDDGILISASVWDEVAHGHKVVFLKKENEVWEMTMPGIEGFPIFATSGHWLVVASALGPGLTSEVVADPKRNVLFSCRFYDPELRLVPGELKANVVDVHSP